ncbi:MAG: hypothetical protein WCC01_09970 [Acidimicrobiia bacterium]
MSRVRLMLAVLALVAASCGGATSASTCTEYAAEVDRLVASGASADELSSFVSDTEEHVAQLISKDPDRAEPCVTAVLEAMFTGAFEDLESMFDE